MHIGLDLDGVIVDSVTTWVGILNREAGTAYQPGELPDTHSTAALAACSDRHAVEMLIAPFPMPGAVEAVARLKADGHRLTVITARTPRLRGLTEAWLDYWGIAVDRLHFLEGASKAPTAVAEGIDLMVEDAPFNAQALVSAGVPVLLFGAPYNEQTKHSLIHRCSGWEAVLAEVQRRGGLEEATA